MLRGWERKSREIEKVSSTTNYHYQLDTLSRKEKDKAMLPMINVRRILAARKCCSKSVNASRHISPCLEIQNHCENMKKNSLKIIFKFFFKNILVILVFTWSMKRLFIPNKFDNEKYIYWKDLNAHIN
jgi:hypothetical protein